MSSARSHAAGRPAHVDPGQAGRYAYAVAGTALLCGSVYGLAGHLFGDVGRAVVGWVAVVVVLLALAGLGVVLIGCALPDDYHRRDDG